MATPQNPGPPFPGPQGPGQPYSGQQYSGPPPVPPSPGQQSPGQQYSGPPGYSGAQSSGPAPGRPASHGRRTNPMGAYVAAAGVAIFLLSIYLDWFSSPDSGDEDSLSGYNTDGSIPLTAYLGVGLVVALLYAISRARGRQHRGLTLVTMAVGIAAFGLSFSNLFDVAGDFGFLGQEGAEAEVSIGVWIALVGSIVWSVGAGLLAKEPEGDDDWRDTAAPGGRY